ncbi:MAG: carboxymuconolactone decarboxylase family protein [Candidatus Sumerlaeia bacterium]|nr:carboxymuconolactone decarboxylase family protein [Candidatus Sumerlaeia bacterium]
MPRLNALNPADAAGRNAELFNAVKGKLGMVPNMMRTMANSPAVLEAYLQMSGILGQTLNAREREQVALAVAEVNGCDYCASAHSTIGKMVGLTPEQILAAREGTAGDARQRAIVEFAAAVAERRGQVSDAEVEAARAAGLTDADIAETVANVALNVFTNFFNNVAQTTVDFPKAAPLVKAG